MPELPEVEVTRTSLADRLLDARVRSCKMGKPLRWPLGVPPAQLVGRHIGLLQRRGKYLWMPLAGADSASDPTPEAGGAAASGHVRFVEPDCQPRARWCARSL